MQRQFVQSSNLHSVGYDTAALTLEIEFNDASVYQYFAVPSQVHVGLMTALSHGKYFDQFIKPIYKYKRIN